MNLKSYTAMNNADYKINKDNHKINLKELISDKMNNELRAKYAASLVTKYNISRDENYKKLATQKLDKKTILGLVSFLTFVFVTLSLTSTFSLKPSEKEKLIETKELTQQFFAENKFEYYGNTRSQKQTDHNQKAFKAFAEQDFQKSIELLSSATIKNSEADFYLALAFLELEDYEKAIESFKICFSKISSEDIFFQEAKLYLIVAYILSDQHTLATQLFQDLKENSWEQKQLQAIMSSLS